ncbi:WD40-repeat-containing domain protein [Cunninghamella echinulata]|nr:WD40-repeat-containing domain protein [Cunninghamella echinulata]
MNLELLDPWEQEYPSNIEDTLEDGYVLNCRFNRRGTLLAAGCQDGRCVIWDFDTKGVSRNLTGHVKSVVSVSWARNGRYLLSASKDWTCIFWDLIPGTKYSKIRFDTPLMMAQMHPKKNFQFVAALFQDNPVLVDILEDGTIQKTIIYTDKEDDDHHDEKAKSSYVCSVAWNKMGTKIYAGTSKGYLNIIDVQTLKVIYATKITSTSIKGIQWSNNGKDLLINANDRVLRLYQLNDHDGIPVLQNKFQDLVNRVQWNQGCFSSDGEFVIGGSGHKAEHNIYIWDKKMGNLVKILEGPNEPLDDLTWHPGRPIIGSVSSYGNIHLWTTKHEENWSAFAPDFTELEENLEYEEKEDEFDVVPQEEMTKRKKDDEDILVDVTTCDPIHAYLDSDDDDNQKEETKKDEVFYLPSLPFDETEGYSDLMENDNNKKLDEDDDDIPTTPTSVTTSTSTITKKKLTTKKLHKRNDTLDNRSTKKLKKSSFILD